MGCPAQGPTSGDTARCYRGRGPSDPSGQATCRHRLTDVGPVHVVSDRGPQSPEKRALVPGVNELLWGSMNLDSHNTTNFH